MATTVQPTATTGLVKLTVGPFAVAVPMTALLGVERGDRVQPARMPGDAGRVVNRAGEFRVRQLAEQIGIPHTVPPQSGQVALLEHDGERIGFWVDRVIPLSRAAKPKFEAVPPSLDGGCYSAVVMLDDGPLPVLDVERLLGDPFTPEVRPAKTTPSRPRATRTTPPASRIFVVGRFDYPAEGGRAGGFGLSEGCVDEIADVPAVTRVPGAPPHVVGLIEWRGKAVPKIDPAAWCGLNHRTAATARVVIARTGTGVRIAVAAGAGVSVLPASTPHTSARMQLPLDLDRVLGVYEFFGLTLVFPRFDGIG